MTRIGALVVLAVVVSACGGGGGAVGSPSPASGIAGTWRGTITFTKPVPQTVATTWTFTPLAQTSGLGFAAQAAWLGITTRAMTASAIGTQFSASGVYPSPQGCDGDVGGIGTVDDRHIDSTFIGSSSCDSVFEGHLSLTR